MDSGHLGKAFHGGAHYENFPVASRLLPPQMRLVMLPLYAFARAGDDLADEGNLETRERLRGLAALLSGLRGQAGEDASGNASTPDLGLSEIGMRLRNALDAKGIDIGQAERLIRAFRMDAEHRPFPSERELYRYCTYSATPVGRLVLAAGSVIGSPDENSNLTEKSDAICTGLQLINFAQDLGEDFSRQRINVPVNWWPAGWQPGHGVACLSADVQQRWACDLARLGAGKIKSAAGLIAEVKKAPVPANTRLALELSLIIEGGLSIAEKILLQPAAVWSRSPRLSRGDLTVVVFRAVLTFFRPHRHL
jgi:phytoene/squalene synthetase